jgi:hypothetical protein
MAALAARCLHPDPQRRARDDGGDVEEVAPAGKRQAMASSAVGRRRQNRPRRGIWERGWRRRLTSGDGSTDQRRRRGGCIEIISGHASH